MWPQYNDETVSIDLTNPIVLLTAMLVMTITFAIGATGWTTGLNMIIFIGIGTLIISLLLVRSSLPGIVTHQMSLIIGLGWSFWVTSRLLPANYLWLERWENLVGRLQFWYIQASQGGTSYDNLMFVFQMSLIIWATGYMMIWLVLRSGKVWLALIPGGVVILINLYYAPEDISGWFLVYVLLSLLLILRFNLSEHEARWRAEGTFFKSDVRFDVFRDGLILIALVVSVAWLTPPIVDAKTLGLLDNFQGSWQDVQRDWNRLYANLNYRDPANIDIFGTTLTLGGPRSLTDEPVMDVQLQGIGRYWRATVYDEYTGDGWHSTTADSTTFGPESPLALPSYNARVPVTQTYTMYRDNATILYAMNQPTQLDRSARVDFNALSVEQVARRGTAPIWLDPGSPWAEEITYIRSDTLIDRGQSYSLVSQASTASINQLQNSGTEYPDWVTARYQQLPEKVSERTRQLAQTLAAPYNDNFSKARAIELYLRENITYNDRIPQPPAGVDKVDYILFETREAYCDYYASAMIVMLRSLDIPARLAVGFAQGKFDSELRGFHVVNADAHSWVEVYFPTYGWIEFEPTSAQPVIIRPEGNDESGSLAGPQPSLADVPDENSGPERIPIDDEIVTGSPDNRMRFTLPWFGTSVGVSQTAIVGSGLFILLGLMTVGGGIFFWWRRQANYQAVNISLLYQQLLRIARWMGHPILATQTPYEHTAMLKQYLPAYQSELDIITAEYVQQAYDPTTTHGNSAAAVNSHQSGLAWSTLRPVMLKAALNHHLPHWLRRV